MRRLKYQGDGVVDVSVFVNYQPNKINRKWFFNEFCLPSINANYPREIIINSNTGGAAEKWNNGFNETKSEYVMLWSDDFIMPLNHLQILLNTLKDTPDNIGYCYSNYLGIVVNSPIEIKQNFKFESTPFDGEKLKKGNYIDGACLFKRSAFCGFDTTLKRFLDWDLFLNLYINKGISGVYCNKTTYMAFYLDEGISSIHNSKEDAIQVIKTKYNLNG